MCCHWLQATSTSLFDRDDITSNNVQRTPTNLTGVTHGTSYTDACSHDSRRMNAVLP